MSHGVGESGSVHEKSQCHFKSKSVGSGEEFATAVAKIAVAQICESAGFQGFQQSALEKFSDIAIRYLRSVGKAAQENANYSGRTEANALDIVQGLEELGYIQGFAAASEVDHCLASSGIVREIIQFVSEAEEIPFAYSIPPFPVVRERKPARSFLQVGEEPPEEHIPSWLPTLPHPQSFIPLPVGSEGAASNVVKVDHVRIPKNLDTSFFNLQRQFTSNGSAGPSSVTPGDSVLGKSTVKGNPFLTAPLHAGEKEVSRVIPPAKLSNEIAVRFPVEQGTIVGNQESVMETFTPAIEAMKNTPFDHEEGQKKKVLLNKRPALQFKIDVEKKSFARVRDLNLQKKHMNISMWFGRDDEKDEKKRRAQEILKQSVENSGELTQL